MKRCPPHLLDLAVMHLIDEVRGSLRHTIRNKLGGARNAAFYLRKKVQDTELHASDPRVPAFFEIIFNAVEGCVALLDSPWPPQPEPPPEVDAGEALTALAGALALPPGVTLELAVASPVRLAIAPEELQVAVFFALGQPLDAAVARGGGALRLAARHEAPVCVIDVVDLDVAAGVMDPDEATPSTPGVPAFPDVARRVLARWGGEVEAPGAGDGVRATLRVPTAGNT